MHIPAPFPHSRPRRLRRLSAIRDLVAETQLRVSDLVAPYFITEEKDGKTPIPAMPGCYRWSLSALLDECQTLSELGIKTIALFPVIDADLKSIDGHEAHNPDGLIPRAVQKIKQHFPELLVCCDVALDPYTSTGQDGIINQEGVVDNDSTCTLLIKQALMQAAAGADILAPSDMMDGRIGLIRQALEAHQHLDTLLLSYAAKYASTYYGPFREAVGSGCYLGKADKKTYQMNPCNRAEALHEVSLDIAEGADMVMIKPGLPYLDIVRDIKNQFQIPTFAYHVSGEYSMLQHAIQQGWVEKECLLETLLCFKRAGADGIFTYFAKEAATLLQK